MNIADVVAKRSNCIRRSVGAIIVKDKNVISAGYNGTPVGVQNCFEGGCPRCASDTPAGTAYDTCICVHAEENAIAFAARHGLSASEAAIYTTLRPCIGCLRLLIQAGVEEVIYAEDYQYPAELEELYQRVVRETGVKLRILEMENPGR